MFGPDQRTGNIKNAMLQEMEFWRIESEKKPDDRLYSAYARGRMDQCKNVLDIIDPPPQKRCCSGD